MWNILGYHRAIHWHTGNNLMGNQSCKNCIYIQVQLEQICPQLSPLFVLSTAFWLDASCVMLDFQLLNRRINGNTDVASSLSTSTLHPQRSSTEVPVFTFGWPEFPRSAAGAHCNEASPRYLTDYKGKMLCNGSIEMKCSYGRHTSLLGSSFSCINYSLARKKTESWPETWMTECVFMFYVKDAGFPSIFTRLHCPGKDL